MPDYLTFSTRFEDVSGSKYARVMNMAQMKYARVTQGSKYV